MEGWGALPLTAGTVNVAGTTPTGSLTQLYPTWVAAGASLPIPPMGGPLRKPVMGEISQITIKTDQVNGGVVELWDVSGLDYPADVSSGTTITNAQLVALAAQGKAKLVWSESFTASPSAPPANLAPQGMRFMRGLAARFGNSGSTGTVYLNLIIEGGYVIQDVVPCGFTG